MLVLRPAMAFLGLASAWLIALPAHAQIQSSPATVPAPKTKLPPPVKYSAGLVNPTRPIPSRLAGWTCSGLVCTLRTTGPATDLTLRRMCDELHLAAKAQSIKFGVTGLQAVDEVTGKQAQLDRAALTRCNQR